ncbi:hypothetical protein [Mesoflavibacter sp. CH_XMU1422-2]|uniref:hypothetical protein n=1 Tax=Mesoflavibacter sp. CH_XMU1422-2 TaxID=3107770 RepID=UPI00300AA6D3
MEDTIKERITFHKKAIQITYQRNELILECTKQKKEIERLNDQVNKQNEYINKLLIDFEYICKSKT